MFADRAKIYIRSGNGGNGHVSFRREKYVPAGGPDGGDGGRGGDIIFQIDKGMNTLNEFRHIRKYVAKNGEEGGKRRCHGSDAEDLIIKVPEGTVLREETTGKVVADMSGENERVVVLKGGRGGKGNMNYATPTMQAPKYAQPGKPGLEMTLIMELKVIADVGLVGFPNVGKSTLLSRVTNAQPKIANYQFTTLNPNLGVVDLGDGSGFVIADIPGLIEGAAEGVGLGHDFLQHIQRCKVLLHLLDGASVEGRDPVADYYAINKELEAFDPDLMNRPQIVVANKLDAASPDDDVMKRLREEFEPKGIEVYGISAVSGQGCRELMFRVQELLSTMDRSVTVYEPEFDPLEMLAGQDLPWECSVDEEGRYCVEGPKIEKMLGYTNLDTEKGFRFFQNFLRETGILARLEEMGIQDGDTVKMYSLEFDYYRS